MGLLAKGKRNSRGESQTKGPFLEARQTVESYMKGPFYAKIKTTTNTS